MKDYRVYIFDFDGTSFDSGSSMGPVFRAGFEAIGRTCSDEDGLEYMHHSIQWLAEKEHFEEQIEVFLDAVLKAMETPENLQKVNPFPETREVFEALRRQGKKIAIVSGNVSDHIHSILKLHQMEEEIDAVIGCDMIAQQKPAPNGIWLACDKLGVKAGSDVIYVGDSSQDIEAARNAGVDEALVDRTGRFAKLDCVKVKTLKEFIL
ncbi:MAG: HAD family hydrolase [Bacilli bacterium]|nr:HAD family hydrolase [Bacilli bacterium]